MTDGSFSLKATRELFVKRKQNVNSWKTAQLLHLLPLLRTRKLEGYIQDIRQILQTRNPPCNVACIN